MPIVFFWKTSRVLLKRSGPLNHRLVFPVCLEDNLQRKNLFPTQTTSNSVQLLFQEDWIQETSETPDFQFWRILICSHHLRAKRPKCPLPGKVLILSGGHHSLVCKICLLDSFGKATLCADVNPNVRKLGQNNKIAQVTDVFFFFGIDPGKGK